MSADLRREYPLLTGLNDRVERGESAEYIVARLTPDQMTAIKAEADRFFVLVRDVVGTWVEALDATISGWADVLTAEDIEREC